MNDTEIHIKPLFEWRQKPLFEISQEGKKTVTLCEGDIFRGKMLVLCKDGDIFSAIATLQASNDAIYIVCSDTNSRYYFEARNASITALCSLPELMGSIYDDEHRDSITVEILRKLHAEQVLNSRIKNLELELEKAKNEWREQENGKKIGKNTTPATK